MHLIYLLISTILFGYIKCDLPTNEIDNENEDDKLTIELFTKINWIIMEIEKINQNMNNINERFNIQTQDENKNLHLLKSEIRGLNQTIKTDGLEMKQQLFQRMDLQEKLIAKASKDVDSFNETMNKILTDGLEMKQQLFQKVDLHENLITKSSKDVESLNKTINKLITDGMEMKQQLFQKVDLQENLITKSSKDVESLNKTINKLITDGMEMKQQLFQKIDRQENLIAKSSNGIESFITTINKMSQIPNWLTILRRQDGSVNFDRNWLDYKNGFGNPNGEYFIGLDKLHAITTYGGQQELLIVLKDFENSTRYAKYDHFLVGNETEMYKLKKLGDFSGDVENSFSYHLYSPFSTNERDNDMDSGNCALGFKGGWWFNKCYESHLTGPYFHRPKSNVYNGITWQSWHGLGYSLKFVEMMIRPKS